MTSISGAVFLGPRRPLSIEELRLDPPGAGEVRVRMVASGVCHSDLHVVDGEWQRPPGVVLGHEGAAIVEELGPGVVERAAGAAAPVRHSAPAGCASVTWWCSPGRHPAAAARPACETSPGCAPRPTAPATAWHPTWPGSTGPTAASSAPTAASARTPRSRSWRRARPSPSTRARRLEVAALIGCAATTGVGAVRNTAAVRRGETVVVIGLGGVGLSAVMAAADAGAGRVIAIDREPAKLELALECGAS